MSRTSLVLLGLVIGLIAVGAVSCTNPDFPPAGFARLKSGLGPPPPSGASVTPTVTLIFENGASLATVTAHPGRSFEVVLPAGTWDIHSTDGLTCATGLRLDSGAIQRTDLFYPSHDCLDLRGPPYPLVPPPTTIQTTTNVQAPTQTAARLRRGLCRNGLLAVITFGVRGRRVGIQPGNFESET